MSIPEIGVCASLGGHRTTLLNFAELRNPPVTGIVSMFGGDMARRRGKQKGFLKIEGPSWVGYWNETVRSVEGTETWHKFSRVIGPKDWTRKKAQREFDETIL